MDAPSPQTSDEPSDATTEPMRDEEWAPPPTAAFRSTTLNRLRADRMEQGAQRLAERREARAQLRASDETRQEDEERRQTVRVEASRQRRMATAEFLTNVSDQRAKDRCETSERLTENFLRIVEGVSERLIANERARAQSSADVAERVRTEVAARLHASIARIIDETTAHLVRCQDEREELRERLGRNREQLFAFLTDAGEERRRREQDRRTAWDAFDGALKNEVERILTS